MWEDFYELIAQQDKRDREGLIEMRVLLEKVIEEDMKKEKESACPAYRESEEKECESTVFTNMETEETGKTKRWRAKRGESYCYVRIPLDEIFLNEENFDKTDNYLWESGNYFRTIDEAQKYADEFKRILKGRTLDKD